MEDTTHSAQAREIEHFGSFVSIFRLIHGLNRLIDSLNRLLTMLFGPLIAFPVNQLHFL